MSKKNKDYGLDWMDSAIRSIDTKHDATIKGNKILVLNGADSKYPKINDIGIHTWGLIDGLVKYHPYYFHFVASFNEHNDNSNNSRPRKKWRK